MNLGDDLSNDAESGRTPERDRMIDRLRDEAMAERPLVSADMHRRIMNEVHRERMTGERLAGERRQLWRWLPGSAVAALVAIAVVAGAWSWRLHRELIAKRPISVVTNVVPSAPAAEHIAPPLQTPVAVSIDVGGVLFARVWPPQVRIKLPVGDGSAAPGSVESSSATPAARAGSPEWMLAGLQAPASSAQATLVDLVPPNFRALAGLVSLHQQ